MKGVGCFHPTFLWQISRPVQKVKASLIQKTMKVHDQSKQITGKKKSFTKRLRLFQTYDHLFKCQIPPTAFHAVVFTTLIYFFNIIFSYFKIVKSHPRAFS